jgi:hypothetical protein
MALLIRPDKTEVKWHSFAAKSLVLSPKAQVYGANSSAGGRVSFQIQIADAKRGDIAATRRPHACHHSQFDFAGDTPGELPLGR